MIGHWQPRGQYVSGVVAKVRQTGIWRTYDRYQKAEVTLEDGQQFVFLGREPEEFFFRRPRRRGVDRDDVATLAAGDQVQFRVLTQKPVEGLVTHLAVFKAAAPSKATGSPGSRVAG